MHSRILAILGITFGTVLHLISGNPIPSDGGFGSDLDASTNQPIVTPNNWMSDILKMTEYQFVLCCCILAAGIFFIVCVFAVFICIIEMKTDVKCDQTIIPLKELAKLREECIDREAGNLKFIKMNPTLPAF